MEKKLNASQCTSAATKANQTLESKDRGIISRDIDTVISLHSVFVEAAPGVFCLIQFKRDVETRKNPKDGCKYYQRAGILIL